MAYREPQWEEPHRSRSSFEFAAAPAVPASGNPIRLLAVADALVFLGRSFNLPISDIARAMKLSRETCYQALRRSRAILEPLAKVEPRPGRHCACGKPRAAGRRRCEDCLRERMRNRRRAAAAASVGAGGDGPGA